MDILVIKITQRDAVGRVYWPTRNKDIAEYCKSCSSCQVLTQWIGDLESLSQDFIHILYYGPKISSGLDNTRDVFQPSCGYKTWHLSTCPALHLPSTMEGNIIPTSRPFSLFSSSSYILVFPRSVRQNAAPERRNRIVWCMPLYPLYMYSGLTFIDSCQTPARPSQIVRREEGGRWREKGVVRTRKMVWRYPKMFMDIMKVSDLFFPVSHHSLSRHHSIFSSAHRPAPSSWSKGSEGFILVFNIS